MDSGEKAVKRFGITDLKPYLYYMIIKEETQVSNEVREAGPLFSRSQDQIANAMHILRNIEARQTIEFRWCGPTYFDPDGHWKTYQIANQEHLGNECLVLECMSSGKHMVVDSVKDGWINLYAYDAFGQKTKFQMDLKYAGPIRFQSEAAKRRYYAGQEK